MLLFYAAANDSSRQVCPPPAAFGTVNRNYFALHSIPQMSGRKTKLHIFVPKLDPSCSVPDSAVSYPLSCTVLCPDDGNGHRGSVHTLARVLQPRHDGKRPANWRGAV